MNDQDKTKEQLIRELSELRACTKDLTRRLDDTASAQSPAAEPESWYRTVFEHTGTATVIIDNDMTISLANAEFENLSGYTKQEIEGKKGWPEFVPEDDVTWMKHYHQTRRHDPQAAPRNYEFHFIDRTGSVKNIYMTIGIIPGTLKSVASFLDLTRQKQIQKALTESEERFRNLVENLLIGVMIIQDGEIVYQNPEQKRLFQPYSFGSVCPDDADSVKEFLHKIATHAADSLECNFSYYPEGKIGSKADRKWVHCRASSIEYQAKAAVLINMMDTTRTKRLEQLVNIQHKMTSLGHIAAGLAHEIRNPLSGINIFLDNIREDFENPESADDIKNLINQAQGAVNKIESVIKRVLDFSRPGEPHLRLTDINVPIREALNLSTVSLRKSRITLEKSLRDDLPNVLMDPQLIEQVLLNLINNAAEAVRTDCEHKTIGVVSGLQDNYVALTVYDSGPGVPEHLREKIFDPFFTTRPHGSGIGLSICQRIVTDHNGILQADMSHLGGAAFTVKLPLQEDT